MAFLKNKFFLFAFKRIDPKIRWSFIGSVIFLLVYECLLTTTSTSNEILLLLGKAGNVLIQILYAFITGFIFYFLIEFMNEEKKRFSIVWLVSNKVSSIKYRTYGLMDQICRAGKLKIESEVTRKEFRELCELVEIHNTKFKNMIDDEIVASEFIFRICEANNTDINSLLIFADLLDEKWISAMSNISNSIDHIFLYMNMLYKNSKLDFISSTLWHMYTEVTYLSNLAESFGKKYKSDILTEMGGGYIRKFNYTAKG